jgi:hypothetical protein
MVTSFDKRSAKRHGCDGEIIKKENLNHETQTITGSNFSSTG